MTSRPVRRASRPMRMSASGPTRSTPSRLNSKRESSVSVAVMSTSPVPSASSSASAPTMTVGASRTMFPEEMVEIVTWSPATRPSPSTMMISSVAVIVRLVIPVMSPAITTRPRERSDSSPSPTSSPGASVSTTWSASAVTAATVKLRLLRPKPRASISWPIRKPSAAKSPALRVNEFVGRSTSSCSGPVNARVAWISSDAGAGDAGDDDAAGAVVDARGQHALGEARGHLGRRPLLEDGEVGTGQDVRDDQRVVRVVGGLVAEHRVVDVQAGLEVDAAAVLPVLEVGAPDGPQDVRLPQREVAAAGLVLERPPLAGDLLLRVGRLVDDLARVGVDLALDAERRAVGSHDADRPGHDVAVRGPVQPDPQDAVDDLHQLARAVGIVRVVRIDQTGRDERVEGQEVVAQVEVDPVDERRREVALVDREVLRRRGAAEHLVPGVRGRLEEAARIPVERIQRIEVRPAASRSTAR